MNNEGAILERLDRIETQLAAVNETTRSLKELKEDITPLLSGTFQILAEELGEVESGFQLDDLYRLLIRMLRNVRNLNYALAQMENVIDFAKTVEPLLKSSVPQLINYLDELEQKGVIRIYKAALGVRAKIADAYSPEDIEQIGDGLVVLLGLAKRLGDPKAKVILEKMAEIPADLDLDACKGIGPVGFLSACSKSEVKEGLGVLMELTKAMGKLKSNQPVS
ncbi:MAG: DUF1641 domain-containing protein [Deltaproteobacteria bacterium]|nr:DUF1641 domain-containing protein [Deltaproteobacteria bacterium]